MNHKALDMVQKLLQPYQARQPILFTAYAPANIALCKYWGKRDSQLNLPINDSLSISLDQKGTTTTLEPIDGDTDDIEFNQKRIAIKSSTYQKIVQHLDLFRHVFGAQAFRVTTHNTIATSAGLASSASGFAALTQALVGSYQLSLPDKTRSILARLGSGSACRSINTGFMWWHKGSRLDGLDSFATPITTQWPELRVGILTLHSTEKTMSSRAGMEHTMNSSILYQQWPQQAHHQLAVIREAILNKDIVALGATSEHNALSLHATMLSAWPPLCYWTPETLSTIQAIWQARQKGVQVYFTIDAGPNLKLLFESSEESTIKTYWPQLDIIQPFKTLA